MSACVVKARKAVDKVRSGKMEEEHMVVVSEALRDMETVVEALEKEQQVREVIVEQLPLARDMELRACEIAWKTEAFLKEGMVKELAGKLQAALREAKTD